MRLKTGAPGFESTRSAAEVAVALELEALLGQGILQRGSSMAVMIVFEAGLRSSRKSRSNSGASPSRAGAGGGNAEQAVVEAHFGRAGVGAETQCRLPLTLTLSAPACRTWCRAGRLQCTAMTLPFSSLSQPVHSTM